MTNVSVNANLIKLNSKDYVTVGKRFETTTSSPGMEIKRYNRWDGGLGLKRETPRMRPGMAEDSTCETGYDGQITPPLLIQTATQAGTPTQTGRIFAFGEIGGVLIGFSLGDSAGTVKLLGWEWDGATETWTRYNVPDNWSAAAETAVGKNVAIINGNLVVGHQKTRACHSYSSTGAQAWNGWQDTAIASNTEWLSNFGTSATGYALLANRGLYSFTLGADMALVLAAVYPSTETVKAFFSWKNSADADVLYILTDKHIRQSNATPNAFNIWETFPSGGGQCALPLGSDLYVAHGSYGAITRYRYDANAGLVRNRVGLDDFDGLASDRRGPVTQMWSDGSEWLFALVSGDATGLYTSVFKRRLEDGSPWHHVYKAATANQSAAVFVGSNADESTPVPRLHIAQEASSTTDNLYFMNYPLENPVNNTSVEYENGGTHIFPAVTYEYPGAFYKAVIVADGLVDGAETVTLKYAVDGGSYVTTSLANSGVFNASNKSLLVASGAGVAFTNRIQFEVIFARGGTSTNAAKFKELHIYLRSKKPVLLSRRLLIDANESKDTAKLKDGETVLSTLQGLQGNAIQYALVLQLQGSNTGTKYVSLEEVKTRGEAPFEFVAEKHLSGDYIEVTTTELVSLS